MNDLLAGLGVALVLEGLLWAAAPQFARRTVEEIANFSTGRIQICAVAAVAVGVFVVWLARG
ncbi:DUF2065 domain-containing protein [Hyphomicrobium sp. B1]|jgi:uncharacterized protein YjeT (DUF2065 family)|uniref:DUF2065 domain-containing protein n=1 Tax=unclassified Hyphomicrobium TaxID=2619925 RepID=UPI000213E464|nr:MULTISPECIES: DUF2065 domain-containing protein [unclassified Hyphomicrobium]CCB67096.1 conserved exported protein of unknown function [Hyphomicrobium sp. MC1]